MLIFSRLKTAAILGVCLIGMLTATLALLPTNRTDPVPSGAA